MESKETPTIALAAGPFEPLDRHWRWWLLLFWLAVAGFMVYARWGAIQGFALGDTDDNMRMMQVRGLLAGQGWYDLQQHRLAGSDIHWSRLVDLPIAALKLLLAPLLGGRDAEKVAVTVAPLLPMLAAMAAVSVMARRLIHPLAFPLAVALLACAGSAKGMWQPLRIDHHGWQLAMLAWAAASLTDPRRARGGVTLGLATAGSLAIGMEMLLYLAACGAIVVLMWVRGAAEARRLFAYGVTLAGGCAFAFLVFASEANRAPVCDALSPVWLSAMAVAGAVAVLLAWASPAGAAGRLGLAAGAGLAVAGAFAWTWPHCLGRLEQSSPELERLWLSRVREAMPIWRHGAQTAALTVTLPAAGLIGYAAMLWKSRRDPARLIPWAAVAALAAIAAALLNWQTRAGPAAQLLSIPGATALVWLVVMWVMTLRTMLLRVAGVALAFLIASGLFAGYVAPFFARPMSQARRTINIANNRCPTLAALAPVARQPRGRVLTFVDLGPRLITVTPHDAVTGPYHRNARQIIDVMRAWRGDADNAWRTVARYRIDYVLICPNLSESTIYRSEAPNGFYIQLARGKVPDWLAPVPLPANSPYRMWRVRSSPEAALDPVDHELRGERGQDHAEQAGDHRLHLVAEQPHQRPGEQQAEQGEHQRGGQRGQHHRRLGEALAARHQQHHRGDRARPGDHRDRHREDRDVLHLARAHLLGPALAPLGALFEHHVDRDQEQEDAAGDPEGAQRDAEMAQQILAEQGEEEQDPGRDADRADRHHPAVARLRPLGHAGEDRRAARRVDHHQEGDEGGDEQLGHCRAGPVSRPDKATQCSVPFQIRML